MIKYKFLGIIFLIPIMIGCFNPRSIYIRNKTNDVICVRMAYNDTTSFLGKSFLLKPDSIRFLTISGDKPKDRFISDTPKYFNMEDPLIITVGNDTIIYKGIELVKVLNEAWSQEQKVTKKIGYSVTLNITDSLLMQKTR